METSNAVLLEIYESAQHGTPLDFNEYALAKFKSVMSFDSAVVADCSVTATRAFSVQSLHLHAVPLEKLLDRQKIVGAERLGEDGSLITRDAVLKNAYAQRGTSVITDIADMAFEADIAKYCKRFDTAHSLTFVSGADRSGSVSTVSLWRAVRKNGYQETHRAAANLLLPHVLQARKINQRLSATSASDVQGSSTALANFNGCLHFADQWAIQLLQREWAQWAPPMLPQTLVDALRRQKEHVFIGAAIVVKASVQGNMLCLVISAKTKGAWNLTAAESRVARLAADGLTYKEIARRLGVSTATVRNQLHAAYAKAGVTNKTALAAALSS